MQLNDVIELAQSKSISQLAIMLQSSCMYDENAHRICILCVYTQFAGALGLQRFAYDLFCRFFLFSLQTERRT